VTLLLAAWVVAVLLAVGAASASPSPAAAPAFEPPASVTPTPTATPTPSGTATPVPTPSPTSVSVGDARAALDAFTRAFYIEHLGVGQFRATTDGTSRPAFWRSAELMEMAEDASLTTRTAASRRMVKALRRGVLARFGSEWTGGRKFNDDVLWMVLAFVRAYELTGDKASRSVAQRNFDAVMDRGLSDDLGGGLWWTTDATQKNACVNGPGAIAAFHLYVASKDPAYLDRAKSLYAWERERLFDTSSGAVYDHISPTTDGAGKVNRQTYTYNQGTFIGAARVLYLATGVPSYFVDALQAFGFARDRLTVAGVLRAEGPDGGDGGGFKGIFARYAGEFARAEAVDGAAWLTLNAQTAWANRDARGLVSQDWTKPTASGRLYAFDCSSAVVLLQELSGP
jgi:predicted alpha-1,6-mannanase (GH76 family)